MSISEIKRDGCNFAINSQKNEKEEEIKQVIQEISKETQELTKIAFQAINQAEPKNVPEVPGCPREEVVKIIKHHQDHKEEQMKKIQKSSNGTVYVKAKENGLIRSYTVDRTGDVIVNLKKHKPQEDGEIFADDKDGYIIDPLMGMGESKIACIAISAITGKKHVILRPKYYVKTLSDTALNHELKKEFELEHKIFPNRNTFIVEYDGKFGSRTLVFDELYEEETLQDLVSTYFMQMTIEEKMPHFLNLARQVKTMHDKDILHNDIKAENVFVKGKKPVEFELFIKDLGYARSINKLSRKMLGTPMYMAPEKFSKAEGISLSSDIFSLGAVFVQMAYRYQPVMNLTKIDVISTIEGLREAYNKYGDKWLDLCLPYKKDQASKEMHELFKKMLSVDPAKRPTIQEVIAELEKIKA